MSRSDKQTRSALLSEDWEVKIWRSYCSTSIIPFPLIISKHRLTEKESFHSCFVTKFDSTRGTVEEAAMHPVNPSLINSWVFYNIDMHVRMYVCIWVGWRSVIPVGAGIERRWGRVPQFIKWVDIPSSIKKILKIFSSLWEISMQDQIVSNLQRLYGPQWKSTHRGMGCCCLPFDLENGHMHVSLICAVIQSKTLI